MDKMDISFEAYCKWQSKEQEYEEFENQYRKDKAAYEEKQDDLSDRQYHLRLRINDEYDKLYYFTRNQDVFFEQGEDKDFYQKLDFLLQDSEQAYYQESGRLNEQEEELDQDFRKQRSQYEDELDLLRRAYGKTLE